MNFFDFKHYFIGCNYWASNAGTAMWHEWDLECIRKDFACMAENGIEVLRIFPLWPDFQPIERHDGWAGNFVEFRFHDSALPDTEAGRAGIDEKMLERFQTILDLAEEF